MIDAATQARVRAIVRDEIAEIARETTGFVGAAIASAVDRRLRRQERP